MKFSRMFLLMTAAVLMSQSVKAQSLAAIENDIAQLREDVQVLQRQSYRDKENGITPASAQDVAVKMGQFDETLRGVVGHMDELEFKLKALEKRLEVINKDVDMRLKTIEGKPIEAGNLGANVAATPKYNAPVAANAPKSIVGDSITKGDDLPDVKTQSAEEIYQAGLDAINSGNNEEAIVKFTTVISKFPQHKLAGNAQYWMGEAYYAKKDYAKAAVSFAKGYEKYKDGTKGADNILKLGMSMKELGKPTEACAAFTSLPKEFPKAEQGLKDKAAKLAKDLNCK